MSGRLNWDRDGQDWPNRAFSRFVSAAGLRWHVQVMGQSPVGQRPIEQSPIGQGPIEQSHGQGPIEQGPIGQKPVVLLIHGTGASTHSFRTLAPMLAPYFTVVAPDLPGHGFTDSPASNSGFTLPRVARNVSALLAALELRPTLAVGHSAGAAVAIRMALDRSIAPVAVVSLNGALLPFPGMTNDFLAPAIRFLATTSLAAKAFTVVSGSRTSVERMMRSTGSHIDAEGMRLYARLAGNAGHVHGAMALMANWDLRPLVRDLPYLPSRLVLVTGSQDGMVPPAQANRVKAVLPKAELVSLPGLGHLAHEEQPADIAELLRRMVPHEASG